VCPAAPTVAETVGPSEGFGSDDVLTGVSPA
jgi:hypothetical protein